MIPRLALRFVVALFCVSVATATAQETTGTILGTVTDASGGVLPGVTISVKHLETSQVRSVATDSGGRYRVQALLVGSYEITAQLPGFQNLVRSGVVLTVAMEAVVNITMSIGNVSENVTVDGAAPLVETTTSTVSNIVNRQQLEALPLNGRSFEQLALLQPGVTTMPFVSGNITGGMTKEVVMAGSRWATTLFLLDGTEMNEGRNAGSASGNILGVESVREFRVLTQNFNAEYGRASGGIVSAVTRSGSNRFDGAVYEFFRNDKLDAPNFFDVGRPPPFTRNQFGAASGGPLVRDRTFYFANVEGLRQRLGETNVAIVPAAHVHNGLLIDPARPGQFIQVAMTPTAKQFLDTFYALPNAGDVTTADGSRTDAGRLVTNPNQTINDTYMTVKLDQVLSGAHKFFVRYTHDNSEQLDHLTIPVTATSGTITKHLLTIEDSLILSPRLLNTFRFGFNRDHASNAAVDQISVPDSLKFVPGRHIGNLRISGFTDLGEDGSLPRYVLNNIFDLSDDLSYSVGAHAFKTGVTVKRYRSDTLFSRRSNGRYDFTSLPNFLIGRARRLDATLPTADAERRWQQWLIGVYVQDDVRLGSRVRLNAGLRYEPYTKPDELDGKMSILLDPLGSTFTIGEFLHDNPSLANFQPRIGLAWDVFGDGRASVRTAFGVFMNPILPSVYQVDGTRVPPFFQSATLDNPPFPNAYELVYLNNSQALTLSRDVTRLDPHLRTPAYNRWHLTIDREILRTMKISIGYSGNRGYHLMRQYEGNTVVPTILAEGTSFFPPNSPVRNPAFGSMLSVANDVTSTYHAMNLSLVRPMSAGLQFQAAYTLSKHTDLGSGTLGAMLLTQGAGTGLVSSDPDNLERDRGLSAWDRRHNFVFNAVFELPFGQDRRVALGRIANQVFGGWNVNTIVTLSSGVPLNIVIGTFDNLRNRDSRTPGRPDLAPGASSNPIIGDGRDPNHYFDPKAFLLPPAGFYGNLGRNTLISPGSAVVDLGVTKRERIRSISSGFTAELRLEAFNVLNRANFGQPGRAIFNSDGSYQPSAGVITSTSTPSRQVQLGMRLAW